MSDQFSQEAYWSAVSQLAPLVGLALVLETRRAVAAWDDPSRRFRLSFGLGVGLLAYLLMQSEIWALNALRNQQDDQTGAAFSTFFLIIALTLIAVNTVTSIASQTNLDTITQIRFALPGSAQHKYSRRLRVLEEELADGAGEFLNYRAEYRSSRRVIHQTLIELVGQRNEFAATIPSSGLEARSEHERRLKEFDRKIDDGAAVYLELGRAERRVNKVIRRMAKQVATVEGLRLEVDRGEIKEEYLNASRVVMAEYLAKLRV